MLLFSIFPPAWLVGTAGLSVAKILENMEIGHNVMHGQWDWMRDPKIHSTHLGVGQRRARASSGSTRTTSCTTRSPTCSASDNDLGYGIMRVDEDQKWHPMYLGQPLYNFLNACFFEYGIAAYDLELGKNLQGPQGQGGFRARRPRRCWPQGRAGRRTRTTSLHPLLSGPSFFHTMAANATANLVRNLWTHSVIMCGHFPEGVETFTKDSIEGETRGEWYLRQMLGSANISGSKAMHVMTGNLSHQIEHHLFPDLPSNRYAEIAPKIQDICERYRLSYVTGSLPHQVASAWKQVIVLSLPNGAAEKVKTTARTRVSPGPRRVPPGAGRVVEAS